MKDRESKKWLLEEFVKENEIRSSELEMAYKRYRNLAPSGGGAQATQSVELDFNSWIMVRSCVILSPKANKTMNRKPASKIEIFTA